MTRAQHDDFSIVQERTPEWYREQFVALVKGGAGSQDIHTTGASTEFAAASRSGSDRYIQKDLGRMIMHQNSLLPIVEQVGRVDRILDVGCCTGACTAALALSGKLDAKEVWGVDLDTDGVTLKAARARAGMEGVLHKTQFMAGSGTDMSSFDDESFDLVVSVSVLEFVPTDEERERMIRELQRVTKPGGHIYLSTPSPWRFREFHSRRFLGDFRRVLDKPWSSRPGKIEELFRGWERLPTFQHRMPLVPEWLKQLGARWQKFLYRKQV